MSVPPEQQEHAVTSEQAAAVPAEAPVEVTSALGAEPTVPAQDAAAPLQPVTAAEPMVPPASAPPTPSPPPSFQDPAPTPIDRVRTLVQARPEVGVAAAFTGGVVLALILKRLAR